MKKLAFFALLFLIILSIAGNDVLAHVPYFEYGDYTEAWPFMVRRGIEQSIAVYAWLNSSVDIDVYQFEVTEPVRVYIEVIVPVCQGYENFAPWFALVGPGLPQPGQQLPFDIPFGYGAIVGENVAPGDPRSSFYEPFGGKSYYDGPVFDSTVTVPGTYYVYYWDPYQNTGDYCAILGAKEIWTFWDIMRGIFYTPKIRRDEELHILCQ